jgi:hypothetical protein
VEAVETAYGDFKNTWIRPIVGTTRERNPDWYTEEGHPDFFRVKASINKVPEVNDTAMYEAASDLKNKARRAVTPGAVSVIAAITELCSTPEFSGKSCCYENACRYPIHRIQLAVECRIPLARLPRIGAVFRPEPCPPLLQRIAFSTLWPLSHGLCPSHGRHDGQRGDW